MTKATTSWPRESARLAFFAVAMAERKDETLLGLIEQANNAVETYLKAKSVLPPTLFAPPGPAPTSPRPSTPSVARPASITAAPPLQAPPMTPAQAVVSPLRARPTMKADLPRQLKPIGPIPPDIARQYSLAFAAVEPHLGAHRTLCLAILDVCLGRSIKDAADDRLTDPGVLREAIKRLVAIGAKAYLDAAAGFSP